MHIWSLSLCLALSCHTSSVRSQQCQDDQQCDQGKVCCGICASRSICGRPCVSDADCSYGEECNSGSCQTTTSAPSFHITTLKQSTSFPPDYENCLWESDCYGSSICQDGQCVKDRNKEAFQSKLTHIVLAVAVASVGSLRYATARRARKPPVLATQNAPPTGVTREATNTTHATEHELHDVSNGATVIAVEELNDDSPPLPPGAPPSYSSLECERHENDELEQAPPSYDEAVGNSAMVHV
ncbi:hypothetical protein ACROYT_G036469 [Oculina patagonica]